MSVPLTCRICFEAAIRPQATRCGHIFCYTHLMKWFERERNLAAQRSAPNPGLTCPVCRSVVEPSHSVSLFSDEEEQQAEAARKNGDPNTGDSDVPADDMRQVGKLLSTLQDKWEGALLERASLRSETNALQRKLALYESELARVSYENKQLQAIIQQNQLEPQGGKNLGGERPFYPGTDSKTGQYGTGVGAPTFPLNAGGGSGVGEVPSRIAPALPSREYEHVMAGPWQEVASYDAHQDAVHSVDIHPNGEIVISASWDNSFVLTHLTRDEQVRVGGHSSGLYTARFSKKSHDIVGTASGDNTARLWKLSGLDEGRMDATCVQVYDGHLGEVNGMCFHESEDVVASASDDKFAYVFDIESGSAISRLAGHQMEVYGVCFQPGGRLLATGSFDHSCCVWDWRNGILVNTLPGHTDDVVGVDIDRSGLYLASGSDDCTCRIWDLRMAKTVLSLREHEGEVKRVRWSPYSRFLVTTSGDTTALIWDRHSAASVAQLSGHGDHVFDACFSPDCRSIVTASHDRTWKRWSVVQTY